MQQYELLIDSHLPFAVIASTYPPSSPLTICWSTRSLPWPSLSSWEAGRQTELGFHCYALHAHALHSILLPSIAPHLLSGSVLRKVLAFVISVYQRRVYILSSTSCLSLSLASNPSLLRRRMKIATTMRARRRGTTHQLCGQPQRHLRPNLHGANNIPCHPSRSRSLLDPMPADLRDMRTLMSLRKAQTAHRWDRYLPNRGPGRSRDNALRRSFCQFVVMEQSSR